MRKVLSVVSLLTLCLVALPAFAEDPPRPVTVGILLFNKPFITELAGPLDVYHHVDRSKLHLLVIASSHEERITYEGMFFRPNTTIDEVSHLDVLVIPSGAGSLTDDPKDERTLAWIKKIAKTAKYVTSHCEGAFVLGAAGLLDGRDATTFPADRAELQKRYPTCKVKTDQRVVIDGKLITSAGGLASYEASLYVIKQLFGADEAATIATALVFGPSNVEETMKAK